MLEFSSSLLMIFIVAPILITNVYGRNHLSSAMKYHLFTVNQLVTPRQVVTFRFAMHLNLYQVPLLFINNYGFDHPAEFQGDFDIVGGAPALTEAEVIKVINHAISCFPPCLVSHPQSFHLRSHCTILFFLFTWFLVGVLLIVWLEIISQCYL